MEDERPARHVALDRLQELVAIADARGRDDLVAQLRELSDRLIDTAITVVVVGEFKQGKSSLVNALLGVDVCAVDDAVATAVPTFVRHADVPFAGAMFGSRLEHRTPADIAALTVENDAERPTSVLVGVPAPLLERGLVLVDTPGIGGLDSRTGAATLGVLGRADAVLFVTDASQELTAEELEFLQTARSRCPTVAVVLTKADINPAWRRILTLDTEHLARAGADDVPLLPVASALADLDEESGIDGVRSYLERDVAGRADAVAAEAAVARLREIANHLDAGLAAELRSLDDGGETVATLEAAVARSERLQSAGSRWKVALDDGFTDISSDLEHELRTSLRTLLTDAEQAIDVADPAQTWGELEPWLNRRMMTEVMAGYTWLEGRLTALATEVDALFRVDGEEVVSPLGLDLALTPVGVRTLDGQLRTGAPHLAKDAYTALRGLQGGVVLFGFVAQLAGLALTGPAVVVFGVVMGGRSLREERRKQLALRKQKAKVPVRKWLDEVQTVAAKDMADRLREVQRTLRDRFDEQARSLSRSTEEALQAARRAANIEASGRDRRRDEVDRQRAAIERVRVTLVTSAR
jgi:signal recognition particle receptor subunit beta